jgi:hypothetical protein
MINVLAQILTSHSRPSALLVVSLFVLDDCRMK